MRLRRLQQFLSNSPEPKDAPLDSTPPPNTLGSYSVLIESIPKWQKVFELFATADEFDSIEKVRDIWLKYRDSGFYPQKQNLFPGHFFRRNFVDLISGMKLQFDENGQYVQELATCKGWGLFDNEKNRPLKDPNAPFVSSYFTLGLGEFSIERMEVDERAIIPLPRPIKTYHSENYKSGIRSFVEALIDLENWCPGSADYPLAKIPTPLVESLNKNGLQHVSDDISKSEYRGEINGFEFGSCETWFGHKLETEYVQILINLEGYHPRQPINR